VAIVGKTIRGATSASPPIEETAFSVSWHDGRLDLCESWTDLFPCSFDT